MNNSLFKHQPEQTEESLTSNQEDFNQINAMVENLLESLNQNKKAKPKSRSRKKWKKTSKQKQAVEDLRIRDLPFTF
ncbi:MAG: hypothetical protein KBF99_09335 [Leptospiraceae bacterium]|nr:hypothetical protein [Leptospiraceae bacterium]MBK7054347.1 hypothetical protein [Leptospiraceae bacterium]MBK9499533.1 hypothetical protein [Leptospiraceae bacterium]MBP9163375.1 hypothetical protein [Leptospiraceae bacterium]